MLPGFCSFPLENCTVKECNPRMRREDQQGVEKEELHCGWKPVAKGSSCPTLRGTEGSPGPVLKRVVEGRGSDLWGGVVTEEND